MSELEARLLEFVAHRPVTGTGLRPGAGGPAAPTVRRRDHEVLVKWVCPDEEQLLNHRWSIHP